MEKVADYPIKTIEDLIKSGENFRIEDVSPDLMTLQIKIYGEQFDSSITGDVAKSLGILQSSLYRAAAEALYKSSSITALSAEEKAALEIVIKITPGCSDIQVSGWKYLCKFLERVTKNMDSKHQCIVACFAICGFSGVLFSTSSNPAFVLMKAGLKGVLNRLVGQCNVDRNQMFITAENEANLGLPVEPIKRGEKS